MKAALSMVARWLQSHHETLYPKDYEDVQEVRVEIFPNDDMALE